MVFKMVYEAMATFTCPRTITFKDWRLGFTHKALVVAIISWAGEGRIDMICVKRLTHSLFTRSPPPPPNRTGPPPFALQFLVFWFTPLAAGEEASSWEEREKARE